MTPLRRATVATLIVLGVADIVGVPFMVAANHATANAVPGAAVVAGGIIAALTLVGAGGLVRAGRWAWWLSLIVRILDFVSSGLGLGNHPTAALTAGGAFCAIGSVVAFVLLARLRRDLRAGQERRVEEAAPTRV